MAATWRDTYGGVAYRCKLLDLNSESFSLNSVKQLSLLATRRHGISKQQKSHESNRLSIIQTLPTAESNSSHWLNKSLTASKLGIDS